MAIKLDKASCSVVIVCDDCEFWRGIRLSMGEAHVCAAGHERLFHPEQHEARRAAKEFRVRERRRAAHS